MEDFQEGWNLKKEKSIDYFYIVLGKFFPEMETKTFPPESFTILVVRLERNSSCSSLLH